MHPVILPLVETITSSRGPSDPRMDCWSPASPHPRLPRRCRRNGRYSASARCRGSTRTAVPSYCHRAGCSHVADDLGRFRYVREDKTSINQVVHCRLGPRLHAAGAKLQLPQSGPCRVLPRRRQLDLVDVQSDDETTSADALREVAAHVAATTAQVDATHALGVAGDEGGGPALVKLYPKANTPALRDAVIQGLMVAGDSEAMMQLYRQAKTREEKQALLRVITTMGDDAALDLIESELNKPKSEK